METEELGSSVEERTPAPPPAHGQNLLQPGVTNLVKGGTQNGKEKQLRPTALIIQVFHFLCSDTLTSGALLILEGLLSPPPLPQVSQFLEIANNSLKWKATNPEPTPPPSLLWSSHPPGHHPPALITPGPGTRQTGTGHMYPSLLKVFRS